MLHATLERWYCQDQTYKFLLVEVDFVGYNSLSRSFNLHVCIAVRMACHESITSTQCYIASSRCYIASLKIDVIVTDDDTACVTLTFFTESDLFQLLSLFAVAKTFIAGALYIYSIVLCSAYKQQINKMQDALLCKGEQSLHLMRLRYSNRAVAYSYYLLFWWADTI